MLLCRCASPRPLLFFFADPPVFFILFFSSFPKFLHIPTSPPVGWQRVQGCYGCSVQRVRAWFEAQLHDGYKF